VLRVLFRGGGEGRGGRGNGHKEDGERAGKVKVRMSKEKEQKMTLAKSLDSTILRFMVDLHLSLLVRSQWQQLPRRQIEIYRRIMRI